MNNKDFLGTKYIRDAGNFSSEGWSIATWISNKNFLWNFANFVVGESWNIKEIFDVLRIKIERTSTKKQVSA